MPSEMAVTLKERDMKGSRGRCLMLTSMSRPEVAGFLNKLVSPYAIVSTEDVWMPNGFADPNEAKLGETLGFLNYAQRDQVTQWWLKVVQNANTPNWDIVSTCTVDGKNGLVLIEAKAHEGELSTSGKAPPKTANGLKNHDRIGQAIEEANLGLESSSGLPCWHITRDSHYQLSNRFAWAWKVASLGVPVVLVYLGFLNTADMDCSGRTIFTTATQWHDCVLSYADGIVPPDAWNRKMEISGAALTPLIRSAEVDISALVRH